MVRLVKVTVAQQSRVFQCSKGEGHEEADRKNGRERTWL